MYPWILERWLQHRQHADIRSLSRSGRGRPGIPPFPYVMLCVLPRGTSCTSAYVSSRYWYFSPAVLGRPTAGIGAGLVLGIEDSSLFSRAANYCGWP